MNGAKSRARLGPARPGPAATAPLLVLAPDAVVSTRAQTKLQLVITVGYSTPGGLVIPVAYFHVSRTPVTRRPRPRPPRLAAVAAVV